MRTRFFEIYNKVNKLNESFDVNLIDKFIDYLINFLEISEIPIIVFLDDNEFSMRYQSFGAYYPGNNKIEVVRKDRHIVDVFRTLAHEMVHHKQYSENKLNTESGNTGSEIENEANSTAAIIMRNFSKENPNIFKV